ncbi:MAG TPA: ABC transporter permease, partial [Myxococcaceae bacterium]|nr:ABC transporter permease [Myxococcaceae bacterium]
GFRLVLVLLLLWTGLCAVIHVNSAHRSNAEALFLGLLSAPAYVALYLALALALGRLPRSNALASPAMVRILFFVTAGVAGAFFPLLAVLVELRGTDPLLNLLNPFVGQVNFLETNRELGGPTMSWGLLACLWLVAVLTAYVADRALVERERRAHAA